MVKKTVTVSAETDNSSWEAPKKRKKRKPMSVEQKAAAAERLAIAREKRAEANPDYGMTGIHPSVRDLPDDHQLSFKKVKQWIKTQKDLLRSERGAVRLNVKGAIARAANHEGYIRNLSRYLRDGDWCDNFYGEYQEKKIMRRCIAQAYHWYGPKKGLPKFDVGTYYPLIGQVYTEEMFLEDSPQEKRVKENVGKKRRRKKT
jgi:hypothetical protein